MSGIFTLAWTALGSDCANTSLTLQLYDHNAQWITLATLAAGTTGYTFDSSLLSGKWSSTGLVLSGLYTQWVGTSVVYTGIASGNYLAARSGYQWKIMKNSTPILTSPVMTIDNQKPMLTGLTIDSGYVKIGDAITIKFTASEELTGVQISLGTGTQELNKKDGLAYTYTMTLGSGTAEGVLTYRIDFQDLAGNTGLLTGTTTLIFDKTAPTINSPSLQGTGTALTMVFTTAEPAQRSVKYTAS